MRRKKYKYNYAIKKESGDGKASLVYWALSFVLFMASFSSVYFGISEKLSGVVGLTATLLALAGFGIGLKSLCEKDTTHSFGILGTVANGLLAVAWIGLYLAGVK